MSQEEQPVAVREQQAMPQAQARANASATFSINPPESLDFSKPQDWEKWIRRFERFRVASDLDKSSEANQVNTLIYCMGDEADDVLRGLRITDEQKLVYSSVKDGFTNFFVPKKNVIYQRAKFNMRVQEPTESADSFITALYALAEDCGYGALREELLRDRIVVGIRDRALSQKMQMERELDLVKAINMARQVEDIKRQQIDIRGNPHANKATVDALHSDKGKRPAWKNKKQPVKQTKDKHDTQGAGQPCQRCTLLSRPASDNLRLVARIDSIDLDSVKQTYPKLCDGLGLVQQPYTIKLKPGVKPVSLKAPRRVPLPLMGKVKQELQRMEKLGVISRIEEPTEWCSGMVVAPKKDKDKVRICVDLTPLNEAVCREKFILPSIDQTLGMLSGAKFFSKIDANMGFWQIPLTKDCAHYTTFITPFGRYFFNRLPFGISSAPEHFQNQMVKVTEGQEGVVCHMDDVLIWGPRKRSTTPACTQFCRGHKRQA
ncbi:hypothetical protein SRHO_G00146110 [Serrasalmus rhombeus]